MLSQLLVKLVEGFCSSCFIRDENTWFSFCVQECGDGGQRRGDTITSIASLPFGAQNE